EIGVTVLKRDVFLDSTDDIEKIKNNILKAGEVALNNKTAIAIGHVGPEGGEVTAKALKQTAPELEKMGVRLVTVTELKKIRGL
ncbi:MAG: divergent polysaccharide deacetylase family protein, partial [Firmicutes bacterium]|nr:divergent polysaccharide deacetylase family protein [Bacillota bacterium]